MCGSPWAAAETGISARMNPTPRRAGASYVAKTGGVVLATVGPAGSRAARDLALQPDGKILVLAEWSSHDPDDRYTVPVVVRFNSDAPGQVLHSVAVQGLQQGETLVGIDVRPAGDDLYGVGTTNRIYRINPVTGATRPACRGCPRGPRHRCAAHLARGRQGGAEGAEQRG